MIHIRHGVTRHPDYRLAEPLDFDLSEGEHTAIYGPCGSGKTRLVDIIRMAHPLKTLGDGTEVPEAEWHIPGTEIRLINFRDVYGEAAPAYHQQRWNAWDQPEAPTVREALEQAGTSIESLPEALNSLRALADQRLTLLSSGELRRYEIARTLATKPRLLILDNPYIGLDAEARTGLTALLHDLSKVLTIVLVVSRKSDIPDFVQRTIYVNNGCVSTQPPKTDAQPPDLMTTVSDLLATTPPPQVPESELLVEMHEVCIRYGSRTILKPLTWTLRRGERWALSGPNGSGKSTLLSLVCADNPQAYAHDISLFGLGRGTGHSIWDIKRHIGYVSPELARAFTTTQTTLRVVCSGFGVATGQYHRPTTQEMEIARRWMKVFGIAHLEERTYTTLSTGEQRMVLLARAFVKSPALLVLDEPFHGLDLEMVARAQAIINAYTATPGISLILVSHYREEYPACITNELRLQ